MTTQKTKNAIELANESLEVKYVAVRELNDECLKIVTDALTETCVAIDKLNADGETDAAYELESAARNFAYEYSGNTGSEFDDDIRDPGFWTPSNC